MNRLPGVVTTHLMVDDLNLRTMSSMVVEMVPLKGGKKVAFFTPPGSARTISGIFPANWGITRKKHAHKRCVLHLLMASSNNRDIPVPIIQ